MALSVPNILCIYAFRFGDSAPGGQGFCQYVRARQEGAILTLLRHKQSGTVILAGLHSPLTQLPLLSA